MASYNLKKRKDCGIREHERYHLFIIYEDKQVNLHRKDTFSKTHLLNRYIMLNIKKETNRNLITSLADIVFHRTAFVFVTPLKQFS